jgi:hypothetical protein
MSARLRSLLLTATLLLAAAIAPLAAYGHAGHTEAVVPAAAMAPVAAPAAIPSADEARVSRERLMPACPGPGHGCGCRLAAVCDAGAKPGVPAPLAHPLSIVAASPRIARAHAGRSSSRPPHSPALPRAPPSPA